MSREKLKAADLLLTRGDTAAAVALYEEIAAELEREGFSVKAVAISKQILQITEQSNTPEERALRLASLRRLVRLYTALDRLADADAARAELACSDPERLN